MGFLWQREERVQRPWCAGEAGLDPGWNEAGDWTRESFREKN